MPSGSKRRRSGGAEREPVGQSEEGDAPVLPLRLRVPRVVVLHGVRADERPRPRRRREAVLLAAVLLSLLGRYLLLVLFSRLGALLAAVGVSALLVTCLLGAALGVGMLVFTAILLFFYFQWLPRYT